MNPGKSRILVGVAVWFCESGFRPPDSWADLAYRSFITAIFPIQRLDSDGKGWKAKDVLCLSSFFGRYFP
ncbi:hypothetical protein BOSE62_71336 [Bosea sp. 62]|nr:hypothetical protein BOSE21B_90291 [Bosea sp. 21B]CAD5295411.1 hypothetical protein BOSE46_80387 [Bosea sp. 46]CAD5298423.1 hypothetical protein BOSE7B_60374 [Bosea sp. 7B]VVT60937.1 hypothetical protein BOS5A_230214 [Bosea sp. EC-HK365B]VXB35724.1 hypothetical protein BOSE127_110373 [Bosea sp. 127]VXB57996.1 hypothetical protein BOSE125_131134 [Bosea sp. 125]VXC76510.1 hypothetical protein BOSE29B_80277 [Bosea sp. 29B]VXC90229.1 hypothetical protein BOSE62_71336 [Bosea sp. 62]